MSWNDKRPMSPHLQIYDLPMTAKLSVLHRGTGAVLTGGLLLVVLVLVAAASGESSWGAMHSLLDSWIGRLVLFAFTASLYYHFCNGIRHMVWDLGVGLDLKSTEKSSKLVIAATAALTLLTWIVAA